MRDIEQWVTVAIAGYRELHREALTAVQMQHSTLRFAAVVLSAILGVGAGLLMQVKQKPGFIYLTPTQYTIMFITCTIIILVSWAIFALWVGEVLRMARASVRLWEIEKIMKSKLGGESALLYSMHWVMQEDMMKYVSLFHYVAVGGLFVLVVAASLIGVYFSKSMIQIPYGSFVLSFMWIYILSILVYIILSCTKLLRYYAKMTRKNEQI